MSDRAPIAIHVAKTRPPMRFGLPIELLVAFMVVTAEIAVINFWYALFMIPVWWALTLFVSKDYNAPRVFMLWCRTAALDFEARAWGGSSVDPLPPSHREYRGIPSRA